MSLIALAALALLVALGVERVRLDRSRTSVPLRITVTGTRGKTTVARMLASVLREHGRTVLAKTTGSEPCVILPDGSVEALRRRGPASILEQKRLIHRASSLGADTVVAEIMSIHAENHRVEGCRILVPHLVLATNFHPDHVEAQGPSADDVGAVLAESVPPGATVLVPEGAVPSRFRRAVEAAGATLVEVPTGFAGAAGAFVTNRDLVAAAARRLGVPDATVLRGIAATRHDAGALSAWSAPCGNAEGEPPARALLVSAFAANDPDSTSRALDEALRFSPGSTPSPRCVGLLTLRADRGDRTLQWADALAAGFLDRLDALVVTGAHAGALERRVRRARRARRDRPQEPGPGGGEPPGPKHPPVRVLPSASPEALTRTALEALGPRGGLVFGFGNIAGSGLALREHWSRVGEEVRVGH